MVEKDRKVTLQALHTEAVNTDVKNHERNVVLDGRPNQEGTVNPCSTIIRILWTPRLLQEQNQ